MSNIFKELNSTVNLFIFMCFSSSSVSFVFIFVLLFLCSPSVYVHSHLFVCWLLHFFLLCFFGYLITISLNSLQLFCPFKHYSHDNVFSMNNTTLLCTLFHFTVFFSFLLFCYTAFSISDVYQSVRDRRGLFHLRWLARW